MDEKCKNCEFCYPLERFINNKWEYSSCCVLFPMTEQGGSVMEVAGDSRCEMFSEKLH